MMNELSALDILDVAVALAKDNDLSDKTSSEFIQGLKWQGYISTAKMFELALNYLYEGCSGDEFDLRTTPMDLLIEMADGPPPWRDPAVTDD